MKVKVNSSLAGHGFSFGWGQIVEAELFASLVGKGWEGKCDPYEEDVDLPVFEVDEPVAEAAVNIPVMETATKRRRRK